MTQSQGLEPALRCLMDGVAETVLMRGAAPWELDEALEAHGWARGPLMTLDREGLDVGQARRVAMGQGPHLVLDRMVAEGRLGPKVGVGFYRYPGGGGAVIDPLIDDLIAEEAHFAQRHRAPMVPDAAAQMVLIELAKQRDVWAANDQWSAPAFDDTLRRIFEASTWA